MTHFLKIINIIHIVKTVPHFIVDEVKISTSAKMIAWFETDEILNFNLNTLYIISWTSIIPFFFSQQPTPKVGHTLLIRLNKSLYIYKKANPIIYPHTHTLLSLLSLSTFSHTHNGWRRRVRETTRGGSEQSGKGGLGDTSVEGGYFCGIGSSNTCYGS